MRKLFFIAVIAISTTCFGQNKPSDFHLDKDFTLKANGTVKLLAKDAKVFITGSNRNSAHVKIDREVTAKGLFFNVDEFKIDVTEDAEGLIIRENQHSMGGIVGYYSEKYTIVLELPKDASLNVKGDDGDYFVKNINGSIVMDLDDAHIELTNCQGNQFSFKMDDGNIKSDGGKGSLEIDGDDTDVNIINGAFSSIDATLDDGDLILETSLAKDGRYIINAEDGLVSFTVTNGGGMFDVRHDDSRVLSDEKFQLVEKSENRTKFQLSAGSSNISIRIDDGKVKLASR